jgi:hypothetical protein
MSQTYNINLTITNLIKIMIPNLHLAKKEQIQPGLKDLLCL